MAEIIVTSTADSGAGSLRQAIADAQNGDAITFDSTVFPSGSTTSILLSSTIVVNKGVEIDGDNRVILDGQQSVRCIQVANSTTIKGLIIQNGANANGAGITFSSGESQILDCQIRDCTATTSCGGVYVVNSAVVTATRCTIERCSALSNGGGAYFNNTSNTTLIDCIIKDCVAGSVGGGAYVTSSSVASFDNCIVTDCTAGTNGGGINASNTAKLQIHGCKIDNNTSDTQPARRDVFTIAETQISSSTFDALFIYANALVTLTGGVTTVNEYTAQSGSIITFADGAALSITTSATIGAATFTSEGRGYLATAAGIDTSAATLTNIVQCEYGADVTSFGAAIAGADASIVWTQTNAGVNVLLEADDGSGWTTLTQDDSGSYTYTTPLPKSYMFRLFDGQSFRTTPPFGRIFYYIGGSEGSFADASDWSYEPEGTALSVAPQVEGNSFMIGVTATPVQEEEQAEET